MKPTCFPLAIFLGALVGVAVVSADAGAAEPRKIFRASAFAIDITPRKFPVSSNGSMRERKATGAHDPLHARCLVLDNGTTRIAIVVCDSCMIPRDIFDAAKKKASRTTGIPVKNMLMSATHTHTGVTVTGVFQSEPEAAYRKFLVERIAASVQKAHAQLEPAQIGWAVGRDPTQVFNRRWFMQPGYKYVDPLGQGTDRVRMNPGSANLLKPAGPTDADISMLSIRSRDGRPIALLANYSLHYVGGVPGNQLSADYFAEFARRFAVRIKATNVKPAFVGIMSNGTSANINNINFRNRGPRRRPFEQIRIVALSVTDAAFKAYQKIKYRNWVPLVMRETEIELGVRLPTAEDIARAKALLKKAGPGPYRKREDIYARETMLLSKYPQTVRVKLQAIRIGNLGIVSSPCETFVETGLAIKQQSPLKPTFTIELANGYNGYLPTPEHHKLGGYETWRARSSYLAVDAEPKIRRTLLELLKQVAKE